MTMVRSRRSDLVHLSADLRRTLCGRRCYGWMVEVDTATTCSRCREIREYN